MVDPPSPTSVRPAVAGLRRDKSACQDASRRERGSQSPNFFDLKLREAVSNGLFAFDCYNLCGVLRQLRVDRMAGFAGQQIYLSILSFESSRLSASNAYSRALGVIWTAQVGGDVASHIKHFASHHNFLCARDSMAALGPFHQQRSDTSRDEDGRSELTNARPIAWKRDRPSAHSFLRQPMRRFECAKLPPDYIVTPGLLSQPSAKLRIAFGVV